MIIFASCEVFNWNFHASHPISFVWNFKQRNFIHTFRHVLHDFMPLKNNYVFAKNGKLMERKFLYNVFILYNFCRSPSKFTQGTNDLRNVREIVDSGRALQFDSIGWRNVSSWSSEHDKHSDDQKLHAKWWNTQFDRTSAPQTNPFIEWGQSAHCKIRISFGTAITPRQRLHVRHWKIVRTKKSQFKNRARQRNGAFDRRFRRETEQIVRRPATELVLIVRRWFTVQLFAQNFR